MAVLCYKSGNIEKSSQVTGVVYEVLDSPEKQQTNKQKLEKDPTVEVHTFNPRTHEAEAGGSLSMIHNIRTVYISIVRSSRPGQSRST